MHRQIVLDRNCDNLFLFDIDRDNLHDREGQPAYNYISQLVDTSALYIIIYKGAL